MTPEQVEARRKSVPPIEYPADLPVAERAGELAELIRAHQVLVVAGETGSGKSTQLPKICLAAGRGVNGFIGHTQPRRLAARSIAARLADEMKVTVGGVVGATVRFADQSSPETLVKVMTDGILLAEIPRDRMLSRYDTIIIDEAHERSLNIDFLLGYLRTLLPKRRDLKVIITSATIDTDRFAKHFHGAPVVEVSGRTYPVEMRYRPLGGDAPAEPEPDPAEPASGNLQRSLLGARTAKSSAAGATGKGRGGSRGPAGRSRRAGRPRNPEEGAPDPADYERPIVDAARELLADREAGDILVFLPGEREIRDAAKTLRRELGLDHGHGGSGAEVELLPLYARLSAAEQQRVFAQATRRRIVLATNVAETSITVPGIRSVIDTGLARISRYGVRTKVQQLPIESISQASARQRAGRCGRVAPGICIRLYAEDDFETREAFTAPEIQRTNLADVVLRMKSLGLGDPASFPFIDPPRRAAIRDGVDTLRELGALDHREDLSDMGRRLARIPVDPRLGRILLAGVDEDCFDEASILAAALAIPDPRERPADRRDAADQAHARFRHPESDFLGLLELWRQIEEQRGALSSSQFRRWCTKNFLSWVRIREWRDLHRQLVEMVPERPKHRRREGPSDMQIHRAMLAGLISNVGVKDPESGEYRGVRGGDFRLHPSSVLRKAAPEWVVAAEIVETTRRFARVATRIQPSWLEDIAAHLLKSKHANPRWDRESGRVVCTRRMTLFGREIGRPRQTDFGPVEPVTARAMFIEQGLVDREFDCSEPFFRHNGELLEHVAELERRQRRHDVMADRHMQFAFYDQRLPESVRDGRSLKEWLKPAMRRDPNVLRMTLDDLVVKRGDGAATGDETSVDVGAVRGRGGRSESAGTPVLDRGVAAAAGLAGLDPHDFPDHLEVQGTRLALTYRNDPGAADDGVTVRVPAGLLGAVPAGRLEWLVPGRLEDLVAALLRSLPKQWRRNFIPAAEVATSVAADLDFAAGDLREQMAARLSQRAGFDVPANLLRFDDLPNDLRMRIEVVGTDGRVLGSGRTLAKLLAAHAGSARDALAGAAGEDWTQDGLVDWTVEDVPERLELSVAGMPVTGHPAIVDLGAAAGLRLLESPGEAMRRHRLGVRRLLFIACRAELKSILEYVPSIMDMRVKATTLGTITAPGVDPADDPHRRGARERSAAAPAFDEAFMLLTCERAFLAGGGETLPRTRKQYVRCLDGSWSRLREAAEEVGRTLEPLLGWYVHVAATLESHALDAFGGINADAREQLARLVPPDALVVTPWARLIHVPRYLAAIGTRYQRLRTIGAEKDAERMAVCRAWDAGVRKKALEDAEHGIEDPRVDDLRWRLEEFRVSQFAQELGTAGPVSVSRLEKDWRDLYEQPAG